MAEYDVVIYQSSIDELVNSPEGPVAKLLAELSDEVAALARQYVRVRRGNVWTSRSNAKPPGFTLASIHANMGYDESGQIYGGAAAAENPTIFLETPAIQMHDKYPFLSTALDDVQMVI